MPPPFVAILQILHLSCCATQTVMSSYDQKESQVIVSGKLCIGIGISQLKMTCVSVCYGFTYISAFSPASLSVRSLKQRRHDSAKPGIWDESERVIQWWLLLEWILQNKVRHLMMFTQQKSYSNGKRSAGPYIAGGGDGGGGRGRGGSCPRQENSFFFFFS